MADTNHHNHGYIYIARSDYTDPASEDEWNRWYTYRHIPDVLSVPGWLSSRRYCAVSGEPKYLTIHEIASLDVYGSPEHKKVAGWGPYEDRIANFSRGFFQLMSTHDK